MQINKVIFLDRDGVINREIGEYIYNLNNFHLNPGLYKALRKWSNEGYSYAIITNQGGISKSIYTKTDVDRINTFLKEWFKKRNLKLLKILYCPHHIEVENCICRKPNSLMFEKILAKYNVSIENSFMIGDNIVDVQAAEKVGLNVYKIKSNTNLNELIL